MPFTRPTQRPTRRTKCQLLEDMTKAFDSYPDDISSEALSFEGQGWAMSLELAPRCTDPECESCWEV